MRISNTDTKPIGKGENDTDQSKSAVFQRECSLSLIKLCGINLTACFYNDAVSIEMLASNNVDTVPMCVI